MKQLIALATPGIHSLLSSCLIKDPFFVQIMVDSCRDANLFEVFDDCVSQQELFQPTGFKYILHHLFRQYWHDNLIEDVNKRIVFSSRIGLFSIALKTSMPSISSCSPKESTRLVRITLNSDQEGRHSMARDQEGCHSMEQIRKQVLIFFRKKIFALVLTEPELSRVFSLQSMVATCAGSFMNGTLVIYLQPRARGGGPVEKSRVALGAIVQQPLNEQATFNEDAMRENMMWVSNAQNDEAAVDGYRGDHPTPISLERTIQHPLSEHAIDDEDDVRESMMFVSKAQNEDTHEINLELVRVAPEDVPSPEMMNPAEDDPEDFIEEAEKVQVFNDLGMLPLFQKESSEDEQGKAGSGSLKRSVENPGEQSKKKRKKKKGKKKLRSGWNPQYIFKDGINLLTSGTVMMYCKPDKLSALKVISLALQV